MSQRSFVASLCLALSLAAAPSLAEDAAIQIESGKISGKSDGGVRVYKGIPFAASTAGDARWRPPQPPAKWDGVRACDAFGPECPQAPYPKDSMYYRAPQPQSEDCLNLNVWSAAKPGEKLPVMVWIHGGALTRGSGATPTYDGSNFARKGVVLVTINYRLGPLGFLAHPELTAESKNRSSGNYGILDQVAALEWVKKNIAAFGGDPSRVTIFGESAGSFSVNVLVASPLAKGLFHRAIGESGGMFGPMIRLSADDAERPSAEAMGKGLARSAGVGSLAELRKLAPEALIAASEKGVPETPAFRSTPNIDGWVLPDEIRAVFAQGKQNDVPTIVGSNAKEMTTLTPPAVVPKKLEGYRAALKGFFGEAAGEAEGLYPASNDAEAMTAWFAVAGDRAFTAQMRAWAKAAAKGKSKAYWYHFTRVPPLPNKEYLGAFHAAEIAYVFGNLNAPGRNFEDADRKLSETMSAYWVNFAKTGDPNGDGLPIWPAFDEEHEPYMILGDEVKSDGRLSKERLDFIEKLGLKR